MKLTKEQQEQLTNLLEAAKYLETKNVTKLEDNEIECLYINQFIFDKLVMFSRLLKNKVIYLFNKKNNESEN